jgi:hypothetical protein
VKKPGRCKNLPVFFSEGSYGNIRYVISDISYIFLGGVPLPSALNFFTQMYLRTFYYELEVDKL